MKMSLITVIVVVIGENGCLINFIVVVIGENDSHYCYCGCYW